MQKGWNKRPEPLLNTARPVGGLPSLAGRTARCGMTASAAWWLFDRGAAWAAARLVKAPHVASAVKACPVWGWYLLGAYLVVLAVDAAWAAVQLARPALHPAWAAANLTEAQAALWGLPATATSPKCGATGQQQQAQRQQQQRQQRPEIVTPLRPQRVPATPPHGSGSGAMGQDQQQQQHTPPQQNGSAPGRLSSMRGSPYGNGPSPVVTTPEQLQRYMDAFDADTAQADGPELGFGAFPFSGGSGATPRTPGFGSSPFEQPSNTGQDGRSPGSGLKTGPQAPTYRPSVLPARAGGGGSGRSGRGGRLAPSAPAAVAAALHQLVTDRRTLEVWTERFREWMAAHVLQPLVRLMGSAHQEVMDKTAAAGWPGVKLSELGDAGESVAAAPATSRPSPAASAAADEEMLVRQLRDALRARAAAPTGSAEVNAALQAVESYQRLAALLAGEVPRGLLPPAPRGYVALRICQLAEGTCMKEFTWNGGGTWQGRAWTPDLPTDAALLFYLFAAFLEAPRWHFNGEEAAAVVAGPPLFLGTLPARQPEQFYALLPFRPASLTKGATAVLALELGSREPHFTLVLAGEPLLTAASHTAPFHVLLLFLHAANTEHGAVGGRSLEYLRLAPVLRPAGRVRDLFAGRWFGMWT